LVEIRGFVGSVNRRFRSSVSVSPGTGVHTAEPCHNFVVINPQSQQKTALFSAVLVEIRGFVSQRLLPKPIACSLAEGKGHGTAMSNEVASNPNKKTPL